MPWDEALIVQLSGIVANIPPFWLFVPHFQPRWNRHRTLFLLQPIVDILGEICCLW